MTSIILAAFASALLARPLALRFAPHGGWIMALAPGGLFVALLMLGLGLPANGPLSETVEWVPALNVELTFRLDGFSWLFSLLITGIGTLVTIYAGAYFAEKSPEKGANFIALILLFMSAMLGTVLTDHLIVLYVFWELTSLVSFLLIGFDSYKASARKAALQSLIVTAGGGLALFAGILLIGLALDTYSLSEIATRGDELAASPLAPAILVLVLLGAFTKSAQVPFHFWLPGAMAAPTPASAYLHSATMVKLGVYLLARLDQPFSAMPAFGITLIVFGTATLIVGGVRALTQPGFKAILAHSTVGSLGLLVLLIGLEGDTAAIATIGFILGHALYKAALFFCAGTAIHATGRTEVTQMSGLATALPWTAAAAGLAAISMAGLPPMVAFIAKEYIFEAQLNAGTNWLVIALTVLGNAAFVMIALLASIGPFFRGRLAPLPLQHSEVAGMALGPVTLAGLSLLFGLAPALIAGPLIAPAASALVGAPVEVSFSLWHGFTPMLALSAVVVVLGIGLWLAWPSLLQRLQGGRLSHALGDAGYNFVFDGVLKIAKLSTRILQNGDQHRYGAIVLGATVVIVVAGLIAAAPPFALDTSLDGFRIGPAVILAFMVFGAVCAARLISLLGAVVAAGICGFGSALLFLLNGAPDLALTQFSVEVLVVVIMMALLLRLPVRRTLTRMRSERRMDALLSGAFAFLVFLALAAMTTMPLDLTLSDYYRATSYPEAFGRNVVNVILVDFRALDTMGEIAVIAFGAMTVWGLLRRRIRKTAGGAS
ncbi:hydrogen gas-evolving membrane-bound hydrogenase subunit E [Aureimonas mangrovi]|uniref:hydrogen gas-evolving membrane-bound hydrogenase subunit E n=1 Tax=Aureimonas mangrovi TaxID=2758041 RepID=UPI00163D96BD|nr:hydrogen gas-evolving membrane-bound hydrogenase subunit E [Aureimonas mangrovi]